MKAGDTPVITKPDRVARSMKELLVFLDELAPRGINLHILTGICADTHNPPGRPSPTKYCAMERDLISERTHEGLDTGRAAGRRRNTAMGDL